MDNEKSLGERIKEARLSKGYSRSRLFKELKCYSQKMLFKIENNTLIPSKDLLRKLDKILGTSFEKEGILQNKERMHCVSVDGKKLANARYAAGYSIRRLGYVVGVHHSEINRIERKNLRIAIKKLKRIADVLDISIYDLVTDDNQKALIDQYLRIDKEHPSKSIKEARRKRKLSRQALSEELCISAEVIKDIENGYLAENSKYIYTICRYLEVRPESIVKRATKIKTINNLFMMDNELFKQLRLDRGLSVNKLSKLIGVSRRTIDNWEEKPTYIRPVNINKLCTALNISKEQVEFKKGE